MLASGFVDRQPIWANVAELRRHGLLRYCPVCDSYEHRDKSVAIFAGDKHALDEALFLSPFVKSLTLLVLPTLKIEEKFAAELKKRRIEIIRKTIASVDPVMSGAELSARVAFGDGSYKIYAAIYIALGFDVATAGIESLGELRRTETGLIKTNLHQETSIPGVYAAGDCVEGLAQIAVASSHGAIAAVRIQLPPLGCGSATMRHVYLIKRKLTI